MLVQRLLVQVVADAYISGNDEVHLEDFFFLVKNDVFFLPVHEMPRHQAESHIIQKLAVLVLLRIEELSEVVENVVEEEVDNDSALDTLWQHVDELIVFLHLLDSVVGPVVLKVLVDLLHQRVGQWLVASEPHQQFHPVVKLKSAILSASVRFERLNDLDKGTHDKRKKADTSEHDQHSHDLLNIGLCHYVPEPDSGQSCDAEVGDTDKVVELYVLFFLPQRRVHFLVSELAKEVGGGVEVEGNRGDKVEAAARKVGNDDREEHQSDDGEHLLYHDLVHDLLVASQSRHNILHNLIEPFLFYQVQDLRYPTHSKQFQPGAICRLEQVEGKCRR